MKKEIAKTIDLNNPMAITKEHVQDTQEMADETKSFVDPLKLTYKVSDHYAPPDVNVGDWWFKGEAIEGSIDVWIPFYANQITVLDTANDNKFVDALMFDQKKSEFYQTKEYKAFMKKYSDDEYTAQHGINFLVYLIEHNAFASLYCKGTLIDGASKITNQMLKGNWNFRLEGPSIPGKRYLLLKIDTLEIAIPRGMTSEKLSKVKSLFMRSRDKEETKKNVQSSR